MLEIFSRNLKIQSVGDSILAAMPHLVDSMLDDVFLLERPLIEFTWKAVGSGYILVYSKQRMGTD